MVYIITILLNIFIPITLQEVFNDAGSNGDYQKYIILEPNQIYLGGISGINEDGLNVFIDCKGSIIDLNDQLGIWTYGEEGDEVSITIQYCNIINGQYGLQVGGYSNAEILNCNFYNNQKGIETKDFSQVSIENCNFIKNRQYGLAIVTENPTVSINYCNSWENNGNYWENCPG